MTAEKSVIGNHYFNIALSILGMFFVIVGTLVMDVTLQKNCYLVGGISMLLSAALERQAFFVVLQSIISVGALVAFLPIASVLKAAIPLCLGVIAIICFARRKMLQDWLAVLGCVGIILIAAGYAIAHPLVYFLGAVVLTIYSFAAYKRGVAIGLLWGILNVIFAITSSVAVYRLFT